GLEVVVTENSGLAFDAERGALHGMPALAGEHQITVRYRGSDGVMEEKGVALTINPDPTSLWKNLPSDAKGIFAKPDSDSESLVTPHLRLLAASLRGRSHAHEGKYRDDDFAMEYLEATGWHLLVVSDGAGSAKYSRRGAQIACQTALRVLRGVLAEANPLDEALSRVGAAPGADEMEKLRRLSFNLLSPAAYKAQQEIREQATEVQAQPRD